MASSSESTVIDKMIALFETHRESFGVEDELDSQCEFEDKFCDLICEHLGHNIGPDHCGKPEHDYCYCCHELRTDIERCNRTNDPS